MLPKNFLSGHEKKRSGDRLLWVMGLAALVLFAVLASGSLGGGESATSKLETEAPKASASLSAIEGLEAEVAGETKEATAGSKSFGRSSLGRKLSAPEGPGISSIWRTLGSLGLILLILFGGAAVGARFLKKLRMKPQGEKVLELVDCIALGPKRQVFVVSAYGRKIVVGATGESMSVLSEFDQDEIAVATSTTPEAKSFEQRLEQNLERGDQKTPAFALEMQA